MTRVCHGKGADLRSASLRGVGENVGSMGGREWDGWMDGWMIGGVAKTMWVVALPSS